MNSFGSGGGSPFNVPRRSQAEVIQFFKANARNYFEIDEFTLVHASSDPTKPVAEQSNTTLQREFVEPENPRPHSSGKIIIAGHTP